MGGVLAKGLTLNWGVITQARKGSVEFQYPYTSWNLVFTQIENIEFNDSGSGVFAKLHNKTLTGFQYSCRTGNGNIATANKYIWFAFGV